jgi:hypothetical protein
VTFRSVCGAAASIVTQTFKVTANAGGGSCSMTASSVKSDLVLDKTITADYTMPATALWTGSM